MGISLLKIKKNKKLPCYCSFLFLWSIQNLLRGYKCIEKKEPKAQKIQKDVDEKQEMERSLPTQNVAYEPIGSMKPRPLFEIGNVQVKSSKSTGSKATSHQIRCSTWK